MLILQEQQNSFNSSQTNILNLQLRTLEEIFQEIFQKNISLFQQKININLEEFKQTTIDQINANISRVFHQPYYNFDVQSQVNIKSRDFGNTFSSKLFQSDQLGLQTNNNYLLKEEQQNMKTDLQKHDLQLQTLHYSNIPSSEIQYNFQKPDNIKNVNFNQEEEKIQLEIQLDKQDHSQMFYMQNDFEDNDNNQIKNPHQNNQNQNLQQQQEKKQSNLNSQNSNNIKLPISLNVNFRKTELNGEKPVTKQFEKDSAFKNQIKSFISKYRKRVKKNLNNEFNENLPNDIDFCKKAVENMKGKYAKNALFLIINNFNQEISKETYQSVLNQSEPSIENDDSSGEDIYDLSNTAQEMMCKNQQNKYIIQKEIKIMNEFRQFLHEKSEYKFENYEGYIRLVDCVNQMNRYFRKDIFKFISSNEYAKISLMKKANNFDQLYFRNILFFLIKQPQVLI